MVPYPIGRMRLTSHPIQFLHSHPRPFAMRYLAGFALLASHRTLLRGLPNGRGLQRWRKVCEGCKDGYRIGSMASYYINIYICVILCTYIYLYLYIYLFDTLYPITFNVCEDTHIHFFLPWEGIKHQPRIVSAEPPTAPATGTDHRTSGSTRAEPSKARGGWYLWWVISGPHTLAIRQQLVTSIVADPLHLKLFRKTVAVQVAESNMSLPIPSPKRSDQWWFDDPQRP